MGLHPGAARASEASNDPRQVEANPKPPNSWLLSLSPK